MELVVDANILFSALIKSGITREFMIDDDIILYAPEYILEEFFEHFNELKNKTHTDSFKLQNTAQKLISLSKLQIIPLSEINLFIKKAKEISPDPQDALYFATALKMNCGIWSNDKKMKNQLAVKVYTTADLLKIFNNQIVFYKTTHERER